MGGDTKFSTPNADPVVKSGDLGGISSLDPSVIEYDDPDGVRIRQSVPEHPAGIFQYRTPDGSYNVCYRMNFITCNETYLAAEHFESSPWKSWNTICKVGHE